MKQLREIKNRWTGALIHSGEVNTIAELAVTNKANLSDADLSGANLSDADLSDADLSRANLIDANLSGANLSRANLRGANLSRANLSGANLSDADLSDADLSDADLSDADLSDADLTPIRDDIWAVLCSAPKEVFALRQALIDGKVDGSTYRGKCACLVGTLANARSCQYDAIPGLRPNGNRPAERFFLAIQPGHTPESSPHAKLALEWVDEWIANMRSAFTSESMPVPAPPEGKES